MDLSVVDGSVDGDYRYGLDVEPSLVLLLVVGPAVPVVIVTFFVGATISVFSIVVVYVGYCITFSFFMPAFGSSEPPLTLILHLLCWFIRSRPSGSGLPG